MWTNRLSPDQAEDVLALAARAIDVDGAHPLNEEAHFALRDDSAAHLIATLPDLSDSRRATASPESDKSGVVGYLQWQPGYRTAQLVVDPAHRRRGVGRGLVGALRDAQGTSHDWGIWAFGDLPAARGFASALGLAAARGLLVMRRPLAGVEAPTLPDGLTLRGYADADADALLAVNAAAFAHHPEQGSLDAKGLAARMNEAWFDPSGLILGFDDEGLAGFHWTKRAEPDTGEVYVIGIAPRAQGRGYGRALLEAGLDHLRRAGAHEVELYVDMAESVAVRMYESAGFHVVHRDVLYAPEHGSVQKQEQP